MKNALKKKFFILTAAEMVYLVFYLGLIIGDLVPSTGNQFWQVYILLRKIFSLIMAPVVCEEWCTLWSDLITQHHTRYMQLWKFKAKASLYIALSTVTNAKWTYEIFFFYDIRSETSWFEKYCEEYDFQSKSSSYYNFEASTSTVLSIYLK